MSGWAEHEGGQQVYGPFVSDMTPPKGVSVSDMPSGRPPPKPKPKIKGVPGATGSGGEPGSGTWHEVGS